MEIEDIFVFSTLTARIFGTTVSSEMLCTSFERSNQCSGNLELEAQGRESTFTFQHTPLKKTILHLKTAIVRIFFCLSVRTFVSEIFFYPWGGRRAATEPQGLTGVVLTNFGVTSWGPFWVPLGPWPEDQWMPPNTGKSFISEAPFFVHQIFHFWTKFTGIWCLYCPHGRG